MHYAYLISISETVIPKPKSVREKLFIGTTESQLLQGFPESTTGTGTAEECSDSSLDYPAHSVRCLSGCPQRSAVGQPAWLLPAPQQEPPAHQRPISTCQRSTEAQGQVENPN